jgi:hypothetical protein
VRAFWGFFSLTTITQLCLVANQIALLPLQLRVWGVDVATQWFTILYLVYLVSIADLGLRNAGHSQLLSSVRTGTASLEFQQTWALTRAMMMVLTTAFLGYHLLLGAGPLLLVSTVTLSTALDTLIIVRGIWFDTLGDFNKVEGLFLAIIASRIALSITALVAFRAPPTTLAWIMLTTSVGGLVAQAHILRAPASLALLAGGFCNLKLRSFRVVPLVAAEPAVNWIRIGLPVIVFAGIAPPRFTTTYIGLRAVFGLARQIIGQLARYASIQYTQRSRAEHVAMQSILASMLIGVAISSAVIADNGRMLRLWLGGRNVSAGYPFINLSLATGTLAYSYQVVAGILMRSGDVAGVAKRHYFYIVASGAAAVGARLFANSIMPYLALLAVLELLISSLFVVALGSRILCASLASFVVAATLLGLLTLMVEIDAGGVFSANTPVTVAASIAGAIAITAATFAVFAHHSRASFVSLTMDKL